MRFDFESLVEPSVTANGCDLWGIDFIHGANSPILRVFIDAVGGATIEDCEKISKDLNCVVFMKIVFFDKIRLKNIYFLGSVAWPEARARVQSTLLHRERILGLR